MSKNVPKTQRKPGRPRKVAAELAKTNQEIAQYKQTYTNAMPTRKSTAVAEKASNDCTEVLSLLSSGHFSLEKSCEVIGRNVEWFRKYLTNNPWAKPLYEEAKTKAKENSLSANIILATDAMNSLLRGAETTELKETFECNPDNPDIKWKTGEVKITKKLPPNSEIALMVLKKTTDRYSSKPNQIQLGNMLLQYIQYLANNSYPIDQLMVLTKQYIQTYDNEE